jgi:carboxylesterase
MRREVALSLKESAIAYDRFPSQSLHELFKVIRRTKKILPEVTAPTLIIHAREDDIVSTKNADYVERRIASRNVRKIILDDSYHMVTLDNQKEVVAEEVTRFFKEAVSQFL